MIPLRKKNIGVEGDEDGGAEEGFQMNLMHSAISVQVRKSAQSRTAMETDAK